MLWVFESVSRSPQTLNGPHNMQLWLCIRKRSEGVDWEEGRRGEQGGIYCSYVKVEKMKEVRQWWHGGYVCASCGGL